MRHSGAAAHCQRLYVAFVAIGCTAIKLLLCNCCATPCLAQIITSTYKQYKDKTCGYVPSPQFIAPVRCLIVGSYYCELFYNHSLDLVDILRILCNILHKFPAACWTPDKLFYLLLYSIYKSTVTMDAPQHGDTIPPYEVLTYRYIALLCKDGDAV